jgi:hypothetical protein
VAKCMYYLNLSLMVIKRVTICMEPYLDELYVSINVRCTPSIYFYKAHTHIKIQTLQSLTNNLTINLLFL